MHVCVLFILVASSPSVGIFLLIQQNLCHSVINLSVGWFDMYSCLLHWCSRVLEGMSCSSERRINFTNE